MFALSVAEGLIASGQSETVLVVGAEKLSTITDFQDRSTAILFGDGAGASVIRRTSGTDGRGILSTYLRPMAVGAAPLPAGWRLRGSRSAKRWSASGRTT